MIWLRRLLGPEPVTVEEYIKTLELKPDAHYLMLVEPQAMSIAVLKRLRLPNTTIVRSAGCTVGVKLYELQPKAPCKPEGGQA